MKSTVAEIAKKIVDTQEAKDADYGNSFGELYKEFGMLVSIIKLSDKLSRIKKLSKTRAQVKTESIEDSLIDLAAYAMMTVVELRNKHVKDSISSAAEKFNDLKELRSKDAKYYTAKIQNRD